ncbi:MAG: carbohydrate ABC transporter permease, partial [Phormidesmis sp. CAN_BIN44]|nr:carbohydrate ABC transporter permease [Phormidesmis sp. CAN_BIN44]
MKQRSQVWRSLLNYGVLSTISVFMLIPLVWLVSTAFKSASEDIFQFPPQLLPRQPTINNFVTVWQTNPFGRYLFNSTIVSV